MIMKSSLLALKIFGNYIMCIYYVTQTFAVFEF